MAISDRKAPRQSGSTPAGYRPDPNVKPGLAPTSGTAAPVHGKLPHSGPR